MRRSRLVAAVAIAPLALALVGLTARDDVERWMENEPVVVVEGQVGTAHTVGGPAFTVEGAQVAQPGSDAAGYADAPDGTQVVVVDLAIADAGDVAARCTFRLEAAVDGMRGQWLSDGGASEITGCYAEEGSLSGPIGFVVPAGELSDVRLLVGGSTLWLGVPLDV